MNPNENAAAWRAPADRRGVPAAAKWLLGIVAAILIAQYLAGFFFLWSIGLPVGRATPLTVSRFAYWYGERTVIRRKLTFATAAGVIAVLAVVAPAVLPRRRRLHGDARFAHRSEIVAAGLLRNEGIMLGRLGFWGARYLALAGQQGVALAAPPRSGKGVGVVIPTLLTWRDSVVCVDIKKENWAASAGYRRQSGQAVYLIDLLSRDGRTARWNPLDYVSEHSSERINDLQLIANMFFPDPDRGDPFWMASARALFLGIGLYLFATPGTTRTIGEILRQGMANDAEGFAHHWRRVIQARMGDPQPLPDQCVRALYDVIDLAPQTTSSIRKTFTSRLDLWLNPILDAATSASDMDLRCLRTLRMSIYLGVMPKDLERLGPLIALFFQQAIALQTDELPEHNPRLRFQVLMLLDEFPALGRIPIMIRASGFLPGYNVRTLMIMQTPAQLRQVYGEDGAKILLKTLAARIYFAPKDMEDAEEISRELGFTTVNVKTYSRPSALFGSQGRRSSQVSISPQQRALLLPQEVRELGPRQALILYEGTPPIRCRKIRYFDDRRFRRRLLDPPHEPAPGWAPLPRPLTAISAATRSTPSDTVPPAAHHPGSHMEIPHMRDASAADIDRLESLSLEDFAADFSRIPIPDQEYRATRAQIDSAVSGFLDLCDRAH